MEFLEKNIKGILGVVGLVIVAGLIGTLVSLNSVKKEKQVQEKFFALDAKVKKYKEEKFKTADKKEETASVAVDVNQLKSDLATFVIENTGTVAAQIAALELANLHSEEGNYADALALLQKAETKSDLLSNVLIRMKMAQTLADQDKCSEALEVWNKVLKSKATAYLHAEAKISQALCYKKMNDLQKAEDILNQVKNDKTDETGEANREAERILRLLQYNKSFGT